MWKRILIFILVLVTGLLLAYWAIHYLLGARSLHLDFERARREAPCDLTIDLTRKGIVTAPFRHHPLALHGVTLQIQAPELARQSGHRRAALRKFHANIGTLTVRDEHGDEVAKGDLGVQVARFQTQEEASVPFGQIPHIHRSAPAELTLEVEILKPVEDPSLSALRVIGKNELCSIIVMSEHVKRAFGVICLVLSCIFLASAWRRGRRLWRRRRATGDDILYVLGAWPRWSETFLRQDLSLLQKQGLPIHAVALFPGDCSPEEDWPDVKVLTPSAPPRASQARDFAWLPRHLHATCSLWRHRRLLKAILRECREHHIGHIHAEFADLAALLAQEAALRLGCAYSVGVHAVDVHRCKYPPEALFGNASFVLACNSAAATAVKSLCPDAAPRVCLLPHGLIPADWECGPHVPPERITVLFAGRLVPKKGVSLLLDAMDHLIHARRQDAALVITGQGPLEEELRTHAERLGIAEHVRWTGRLSREELREEMRKATCLCVPSIVTDDGDRDGLPNVIPEAMAVGLPVIGTQAGALGDLLTLETGWPVPDPQPELLSDTILDIASQTAECQRRALNARNQVLFRFNAEKLAVQRAKIFRDAKIPEP